MTDFNRRACSTRIQYIAVENMIVNEHGNSTGSNHIAEIFSI